MPSKVKKLLLFISMASLIIFNTAVAYAGNPPDATNSSLTATEVPADGSTQSTITVTLKDSGGTALAGDTVQVSNTTDSTIKISPTSAILDANGTATFTATSTIAGTDNLNVTDTTTSTTLSALGQVIFDAGSTAPTATPGPTTCTTTAPTAPNLYQIAAGSSGSATLYFSPPTATFTGFNISYGLDSNADTYNSSLTQGSSTGAITYTVNSLTPNTVYYFKVQAVNGCATGPWSSVLSSTPGGTAKTPSTGPEDVFYLGLAGLLLSAGGLGVFFRYK